MRKPLRRILRMIFRWFPFPDNAKFAMWTANMIRHFYPERTLHVVHESGEVVVIFFVFTENGEEFVDVFWMEKELHDKFEEEQNNENLH